LPLESFLFSEIVSKNVLPEYIDFIKRKMSSMKSGKRHPLAIGPRKDRRKPAICRCLAG